MTTDAEKDEKKSEGSSSEKELDSKNNESSESKDDDSIRWRSKYKVTKEELETFKAKTESEKNELSSKVEKAAKEKSMYEEKYIEAEVKAHAVAAGIKDIEFVKLIDKKEIKLDDNGNLVGVEKAITDLKARKPDWFGMDKKTSSSSNAKFAEKEQKVPTDARSMSKEEWNRNKPKFMSGQF